MTRRIGFVVLPASVLLARVALQVRAGGSVRAWRARVTASAQALWAWVVPLHVKACFFGAANGRSHRAWEPDGGGVSCAACSFLLLLSLKILLR